VGDPVTPRARDTDRWRLQIVTLDRKIEYDEVFETPPRLLEARRSDGVDTLLLDGSRLEALQVVFKGPCATSMYACRSGARMCPRIACA
jgi:hypothetical protein